MNNWDRWLGKDNGEYLERIRNAVKQIHRDDQKNGPIAFYTPHGPEHFKAVEDNLHKLIPDEASESLDEKERFFLLASAWLHDIGMFRSVAREVCGNDINNQTILLSIFRQFLC